MRIGIIGAGAVGGALAALLARAGHDVDVTARGEGLAAIRSGGLRLTGAWGDYTAALEADTELRHGAELAIVATKAQDAMAAVHSSARVLSGIPVLVVQNGLAPLDAMRALIPNADVIGGLALFAVSYLSPGAVQVTASGPLVIGGDRDQAGLASLFTASVLGAVLPVEIAPDFIGAQWTKLIVNQVNALPAITGLSAQEVIAHPGLRRLMTAGIREQVRVGRAAGVRFGALQGLSHRMLRVIEALPLQAATILPRALARRMGKVPNPGSTQQSIRRGSPTEIDHLNGAVVAAGLVSGVPTPVNAAMVELVHEVETTGVFLTPAAVVARVPLTSSA